jgi:hypothetical protein
MAAGRWVGAILALEICPRTRPGTLPSCKVPALRPQPAFRLQAAKVLKLGGALLPGPSPAEGKQFWSGRVPTARLAH